MANNFGIVYFLEKKLHCLNMILVTKKVLFKPVIWEF